MKTIHFAIIALIATTIQAQEPVRVIPLWEGKAVANLSTNYSPAIDLANIKPQRLDISVQLACTNISAASGTNANAAFKWEASNDGVNFKISSNIVSGISSTNAGNGLWFVSLPGIARYLRFSASITESNGFLSGKVCLQ